MTRSVIPARTPSRPDARAAAAGGPDYAVFTELSPDSKVLKAGWNTRVFSQVDSTRGAAIRCDMATGIMTVAPGLYHLTGMSLVAYDSGGEPPETTTIRAPASAGYCRLRKLGGRAVLDPGLRDIADDDGSILCVGTLSTANVTPSLFEAYFETGRTAQIVLEHQAGSSPDRIYLRVFVADSKWHAMARIGIRKI